MTQTPDNKTPSSTEEHVILQPQPKTKSLWRTYMKKPRRTSCHSVPSYEYLIRMMLLPEVRIHSTAGLRL